MGIQHNASYLNHNDIEKFSYLTDGGFQFLSGFLEYKIDQYQSQGRVPLAEDTFDLGAHRHMQWAEQH